MERIRCFLYENNKKSPVLVPRVLRDMVTKLVFSPLHIIYDIPDWLS